MEGGVERRRHLLVRRPEFAKLLSGQAISSAGSAVTAVAMPLAAVVVLHASPLQMGVLSGLSTLPQLLFGLFAGVWIDRLPRRTIMIVADLARAFLMGSIPLLGALHLLRIEQLYAVALVAGGMTLLFETAAVSLIPSMVGSEDLVGANSASVLNTSLATTIGPSVAGWLVQVLTAPIAIAVDAVSFVLSAACSTLVRADATRQGGRSAPGRLRLWSEIGEGLGTLFSHPALAAITIAATAGALSGAMQGPLVVLYLVRGLHFPSIAVGAAITAGGAASVAAALLTPRVTHRLGPGPTFIAGQFLASLGGPLLALAGGAVVSVVALVGLGLLAGGFGPPLYGISQRTLRQSLVSDRLLGRANATWRVLVFGAQPIGALLGGALATSTSPRLALLVSGCGMFLAAAWGAGSPLRRLRQLPSS